MDALVRSCQTEHTELRQDGINNFRNPVAKLRRKLLRTPSTMFTHAPYELQGIRSDMPEEHVAAARAKRDVMTARNLRSLSHRRHANLHNDAIGEKLYEVTKHLSPHN